MTGMTLDVIIPCYNNETTIEAAITSILRQTCPVTNVIVVDDGSRDLSCSHVRQMSVADSRIKLYALTENRGTAYARNIGLKRAKSSYVAFHDADDIAHPRRFEAQFRVLSQSDVVAVTCDGCRMVQGKPVELDGHYYHNLPVSVFFRREEVVRAIGFMRPLTIGEDVDYLERIKAAFGDEQVGHLWRCLYFAAMRHGSAIYAHGEMREFEPGRYVYLPHDDARAILDRISVWNGDPAKLFVPFDDKGAPLQSDCGTR